MPISNAEAFSYSGWVPYWDQEDGLKEIGTKDPEGKKLQTISPFIYEIDKKNEIKDRGRIEKDPWVSFLKNLRDKKNSQKIIAP